MELDVRGQKVVIADGDSRAAAHAAGMLREGAEVTVISPSAVTTIDDMSSRGLVTWYRREVCAADVKDAFLVIGHTTAAGPQTDAEDASGGGSITLVGGGPGDPDLITIAGRSAIESADVLLADRLCPPEAIAWTRPDAQIIDVAKIPGGRSTSQDTINQIMIEHARAGKQVVRYKGGDAFVFGRGGEELLVCAHADIPTRVIPGISSAIAAPACAGIPVTHRGLAQGFTVVTGHADPDGPSSTIDWTALARSGTTIVILMGVRNLSRIAEKLAGAGMPPTTPAAVIADGGLPSQHSVTAELHNIAHTAKDAGIGPPAVTVIGDVAGLNLGNSIGGAPAHRFADA